MIRNGNGDTVSSWISIRIGCEISKITMIDMERVKLPYGHWNKVGDKVAKFVKNIIGVSIIVLDSRP